MTIYTGMKMSEKTQPFGLACNEVLVQLPPQRVLDRHLPTGVALYGYNADDLRAYAAQAVAADRDRCAKLQQVWEDTRTQRDELLAHIAGKAPLPPWAAVWLRANTEVDRASGSGRTQS